MKYPITNEDFLRLLIGNRQAKELSTASLSTLFAPQPPSPMHAKLFAARELVFRWLTEELEDRPVFQHEYVVRQYLQMYFAGKDRETFLVLFLDSQLRLCSAEELFVGTINQAQVYPREVLRRAIANNATAIVIAHNHPSGRMEPSDTDLQLTDDLQKALAYIDVRLIDHFIVGHGTAMSFLQQGLLSSGPFPQQPSDAQQSPPPKMQAVPPRTSSSETFSRRDKSSDGWKDEVMATNADSAQSLWEDLKKDDPTATLSDAKQRQRELLHLYWILAHKPPEEGEPYRDPPPPP